MEYGKGLYEASHTLHCAMQRGYVESRTSWHKWSDLPLRLTCPSVKNYHIF
uniref:Uncharacterized protein n=1 Tax=Arundo donax TaxID=35708 RepID=A0A0A9E3T4_ARUDO